MSLKQVLFSFQGRIPRSTWWYFILAVNGIALVLAVVDGMIAAVMGQDRYGTSNWPNCLVFLFSLLILYPNLAVSVKRAHDRDHSGWFILIGLIPIIGPIWVLIEFGFLRGTVGPNQYGPDPTVYQPVAAT